MLLATNKALVIYLSKHLLTIGFYVFERGKTKSNPLFLFPPEQEHYFNKKVKFPIKIESFIPKATYKSAR